MAKQTKATEKAYANALKNLFSPDDQVVISGVEELAKYGDHRVIHPLLEVMLNGSEAVNTAVQNVLYQLKDTKAMAEMVEALDNPKYESLRPVMLASFWNTGQWPTEHLLKLCEIAVNGTFEEAFEVLTIVEHMEGNLEPAELELALEPVREFLMTQEGHANYTIIESIHSALNSGSDV